MQTETVLPWQKEIWGSLLQRNQQNRLPHALLFSGADGIGKNEFAQHFASYLLCSSTQKDSACGSCRSCCFQRAKTHPDFMRIELEEGAQLIKIDQIREVVSFVNGTAMLNENRVIVIHPVSAMNIYAANALLKTLEEPIANTFLILICNQSLRLTATISSRCQKVIFPKPPREMALQWLQSEINDCSGEELSFALDLANGSPLQARDLVMNESITLRRNLYDGLLQLSAQQVDPLQFAAKWEDKDVKMVLNLILVWLRDILRFKVTESKANLINSDYHAAISQLIEKFSTESLLQYGDIVQKTYAQVMSSLNMNRQLLLKEIFIRWVKLC